MDSHPENNFLNSIDDKNQLETDGTPNSDHHSDASTDSGFDCDCFPDFSKIESMFKVEYNGMTLYGEGLPSLGDIKLSYRDAWRVCKQGSHCICRKFSEPKSFNATYFAVCDGTDPVNFLVLTPSKSGQNRIIISFWEILGAYWVWNKFKLFYIPSKQSKPIFMVIEGLSAPFCEAMLKCLYECQLMINTTKTKLDEIEM